MRPAAYIKPWLSTEKMSQWVQDAPDEASYKRRTAIWLTHKDRLHANKVARTIGVSTQAVWLWIGQYNTKGPAGLERKGRGGRRWGFMNPKQEAELLKPFMRKTRSGHPPKPEDIKKIIEKTLGTEVSMPYVYRLLQRHGWSGIIAQSKLIRKPSSLEDDFQKLSRPWLRQS